MNSQQCRRIKLNYVHRYALFQKKTLGSAKSKIEDPCWPNSFRKEKKKTKITEMQLKQM